MQRAAQHAAGWIAPNAYASRPADDDADAAAGDVDFVSNGGKVGLLQYFHFDPPTESFPGDEVPTCIVRANGHVWMADPNGRLFRRNGPTSTQVSVVGRTGEPLLHHVTGCSTAGADDGVIHLVNMWPADGPPTSHTGSVVRYDVEYGIASIVANGLNYPSMLAVGTDRIVYVSANSVCPASGGPRPDCDFLDQTSGVLLKLTLPEKAGRAPSRELRA